MRKSVGYNIDGWICRADARGSVNYDRSKSLQYYADFVKSLFKYMGVL